jgi:uncharacterized protein
VDEVIDDPDTGRLALTIDGRDSELVYRVVGRRLVIVHTSVPEELAGRGLGGVLVGAALAKARRDGLTVVPLCPFAHRWLAGHPDEVGDLAVDWDARG